MFIRSALLLFAILVFSPFRSQVLINEYSCSNLATYLDNYNEYEDWVELYNTSAAPVNLNGYFLSDKANNLNKWAFGNVTIPANGFLRVWASGKNINTGINLHTNFSLTQCENEKIIFSSPAQVVIDSLTLVRTQLAHSRGRTTNGAATWSLFIAPTPNASNNTATPYLGYALTPSMSHTAGVYNGAQTVSITVADPNLSIRYTTNGSTPTGTSNLYTGPVSVSTTQVLRAVAISTNTQIRNSFVESNTYFINTTHSVNLVSVFGDQINTLMNGTQIKPYVGLEYFDMGVFKTEGFGQANEHGNDSWAYAQRGIDFVCRDECGYNNELKHQIFNLKTRKKFQRVILKAAANDNYPFEGQANANFAGELGGAHIRDQYVHTVSQKAGLHLDERTWAPAAVYINGQYWGLYDIREKVDDKDFTDYYYDSSEDSLQFLQTWGGTWAAYGGTTAINDWTTFKNWVAANSMTNQANYNTLDGVYNIKSLADYVIINSYVVCMDWLNWNTAWWRGLNYKCDKKKWRYAMWDEDATFKHYINYTGVPNLNPNASPCDPQSLNNPGGQGHIPILNSLLTNPTFKQYYVMRYFDLLNTGLSCNRMLAIYDSMITVITPEMPKQINRWGGTLTEWQNNVTALRDFIAKRCDSITKKFNTCYQVTGPFKIKVNVDPPNSGTVEFNSLNLTSFTWMGNYPGNLDNYLKGNPKPCYKFSHWTTKTHTLFPSTQSQTATINLNATDSVVAHFIPQATVEASASRTTICPGQTVELTASNANTYTWFPNVAISCNTCAITIVNPTTTTIYGVNGTYTPGCVSNKTQTIVVIPKANANFITTVSQTLTLPQTVQITNTSQQSVSYFWQFINSGNTSTLVSPNFSAFTPGEYTVTLIAYGNNGCNDTLTKTLVINDTLKIYPSPAVPISTVVVPYVELPLPNIFTPNGDGSNDYFKAKMVAIRDVSCMIYDRWGQFVYEIKDPLDKWDGRNLKGKECPDGTYFYVFRALDINKKEYTYKGWVQLQR